MSISEANEIALEQVIYWRSLGVRLVEATEAMKPVLRCTKAKSWAALQQRMARWLLDDAEQRKAA